MKRILLFILVLLNANLTAFSQNYELTKVMPNDPEIRTGKLDNGMTYYIRKNDKPAGMAEFYIIHNVGAIQEKPEQNGLAHFLEHMAFNGTEHFPDKQLLNYLETIGVQFGRNVNAYTSQEETVYSMTDVPMTRETILDSALLILRDWSHYISLLPEEIDKERGVILEELRTGRDASRRMFDKSAPLIYNHTKYADHLIIGTEEILKNFKPEEIKAFYNEWYRPDLQAIAIVGDFDPDTVEKKVKELFASVPGRENPTPKKEIVIPDYNRDEALIVTDPEQTYTTATIFYPNNIFPIKDNDKYSAQVKNMTFTLITTMLNETLNDIAQQPDAPFLYAGVGYGSRSVNSDYFYGGVVTSENALPQGIEALTVEIERVQRYGFSQSALDRAKANILKANETAYENRNDRKNSYFINQIQDNFLGNYPMLSAEEDYKITKNFIEKVSLDEVNTMIPELIPEKYVAIIANTPEKTDIPVPDAAEILAAYKRGKTAEIEKATTQENIQPLINENIAPGRITASETDELGNIVWKLSNGAKVVFRKTDFKQDQVLFAAYEKGGSSLLENEEMIPLEFLCPVVSSSGLGNLSANELRKALAGKSAYVGISVSDYNHGLSGSASSTDIETLLQLVYLSYAHPRFDETDFDVTMNKIASSLKNYEVDPGAAMTDSILKTIYGSNPRVVTTAQAAQNMNKVTLNQLRKIYSKLYNGANGVTFYIVGNVDEEILKPLVEKYLASLNRNEIKNWNNVNLEPLQGDISNIFHRKQETPKSSVRMDFKGDFNYNLDNIIALDMLTHILRIRYTESIREEKGATYGVGVGNSTSDIPKPAYSLTVSFDTNGDVAEETSELIIDEIEKIAKNGPMDNDLTKAKEVFLKNFNNNLKENNAWLSWILAYHEKNMNYYDDYVSIVSSINKQKLQNLARQILESRSKFKIIMLPEQ